MACYGRTKLYHGGNDATATGSPLSSHPATTHYYFCDAPTQRASECEGDPSPIYLDLSAQIYRLVHKHTCAEQKQRRRPSIPIIRSTHLSCICAIGRSGAIQPRKTVPLKSLEAGSSFAVRPSNIPLPLSSSPMAEPKLLEVADRVHSNVKPSCKRQSVRPSPGSPGRRAGRQGGGGTEADGRQRGVVDER